MQSAKDRAAQPIQAVLRARVSSKEQEEEGFSLPAQIRPLQEYAVRNSFVIVQEFIDVESAKTGGRAGFNEMVAYLKKHQATCRTIRTRRTPSGLLRHPVEAGAPHARQMQARKPRRRLGKGSARLSGA